MVIFLLQWLSIFTAALLLIYLLRTLRTKTARGHCLKCQYNLQHTESKFCPECGLGHDGTHKTHATRKWILIIALSLFLITDLFVCVISWHPTNHISRAPDMVLAYIAPLPSPAIKGNILFDEIEKRIINESLSYDANWVYVKRQLKRLYQSSPHVAVRKQRG